MNTGNFVAAIVTLLVALGALWLIAEMANVAVTPVGWIAAVLFVGLVVLVGLFARRPVT